MKVKRRYLALKVDSEESFGSKELMNALWQAFLKLFGEYGASKSGLALIDHNREKEILIVRVAHKEVEKARAAVATITRIESKPVAVHVVSVSGTLKALKEKLKI